MRDIGARVGIDVKRCDFSETHSGKGIWDRKIASMKSQTRIYVNEKYDVLESCLGGGGVRGCRIAVVKVNAGKQTGIVTWDGISFYSSLRFEDTGIRAWRAFGVGEGRLFPYTDLMKNQ